MMQPQDLPAEFTDILVVDDVAQNLVAMEALLTRPGLRVIAVSSGADALEKLLGHEFALALLDVQMPEMDGFALAELMRGAERTRSVPIIFMTAAPSDSQRSFRGYEAGAVDFLHKPLDPHVLTSKVGVFVELFEQRRQLRAGMAELKRVISLNETMAAVLAHDLRTPLAAVTMGADIVLRTADPKRVNDAATRIKSSAQRMERMIAQLLDFSRIRSGSLRLDRRAGDLRAIATSVATELRHAMPGRQIALAGEGDATGHWDTDRMMQVVQNLLFNALNHGEPGGTVTVEVDGTAPNRVVGRIRNRGSIPPDVQQRLFEAFRPSAVNHGGLGLGLYIVHSFVTAHGGDVSGRSTEEGETIFEFVVPRA